MNLTMKNLLQVYNDFYNNYAHGYANEKKKSLWKKDFYSFDRLNYREEIINTKNRQVLKINLNVLDKEHFKHKHFNEEINSKLNKLHCVRWAEISDNLFSALGMKFMSKYVEILDLEQIKYAIQVELKNSTAPFANFTFEFITNENVNWNFYVNVFKDELIPKITKASVSHVADWYILQHLTQHEEQNAIFASKKNIDIQYKLILENEQENQVIVSKHFQNLLEYIHHLQQKKKEVFFRISNKEKQSDWIKIDKIETDNQTNSTGFYFNKNEHVLDFLNENAYDFQNSDLKDFFLSPNEKRSKSSHFIPQKYDNENRRQLFQIPNDTLLELQSKKILHQYPLVENKSRLFNLYFDIDIAWHEFKNHGAILNLKKAQHISLAGENEDYSPLTEIIKLMYPLNDIDKNVLLSTRSNTIDKSGFHLIYKNLCLKNNEVQMKLLYDILEKYIAKKLLEHESDQINKFLLQAIYDEIAIANTNVPSLRITLSKTLLTSLHFNFSFDDFQVLLKQHIFLSLRKASQKLSSENMQTLIDFALNSIGAVNIKEYYTKFNELKDASIRFKLILKLARRIRWEIMRKSFYFDHSACLKDMGLRLTGNIKPNEPDSKYQPIFPNHANGEMHSIRTKKKVSAANTSFHYKFLEKLEKHNIKVRSLKGLFVKEKIKMEKVFYDLNLEFRTENLDLPEEIQLKISPTEVIKCKRKNIEIKEKSFPTRLYSPQWITYNGKDYLVYPPKHRKKEKVQKRHRILYNHIQIPGANVEVKVRVFIPAPVVKGPFSNDFGGDGRGPSYDTGTSRLDMQIIYNPLTGLIEGKQADWGTSHAYDSDYSSQVAGKPDWWLTNNSPSIDSDKLETEWGDNVNAESKLQNGNNTLVVSYAGALPLESLAPTIDGTMTIEFDVANGEVYISADHDGFPQHTLYINGQLVYNFDPVAEQSSPIALAPPTDIKREERKPIPPTPTNTNGNNGNGQSSIDDDFSDDYNNNGGTSWEIDYEIEPNDDGSIELSAGNDSEVLYYDDEEGTWESDYGTCIEAEEDAFDDGQSGNIASSEGLDGGDDLSFSVESIPDEGAHIIEVGKADALYP